MKKILALLLVVIMCLSLVACSNKETTGTSPENTEPDVTDNPTGNLEETRKAELLEILCDGKWVIVAGPDDYASELAFYNDGTMKYIDNKGEEHSGYSWSFTQYVINGEIEGNPGAMPAEQQTRIEYSGEQGQYRFSCDGLTIMIVGLSVDGEYVLHYFGTAYEKVAE